MTAHVRGSQTGEPILQPAIYPAKHPLPAKNIETFADDVVVFTQSGAELDSLLARARIDLPGLAGAEAVRRVMSHNPDSLWAIARRRSFDAAAPAVEGFVAFLTLNEEGLKRLVAGTFDASDPDPALLTPQNKTPAAVYLWAMWAKDGLVAGIPLAFEKMFTPLYKDADVYARAATLEGRKLLETMGFEPGVELDNVKAAHLHVLRRGGAARPNLPSYDRYQGDGAAKQISVTMARSIEDVMRVITVRSAVYISEQECPYLEEFDGNDFCATHFLATVDGDAAGCLRIRWFGDFAKMERVAVRRDYRRHRLTRQLVRAGVEHCRRKGYRRLYAHARADLVPLWCSLGWQDMGGKDFSFVDVPYREIMLELEPSNDAIRFGADPMLLLRPEGRWDEIGPFDRMRLGGDRGRRGRADHHPVAPVRSCTANVD